VLAADLRLLPNLLEQWAVSLQQPEVHAQLQQVEQLADEQPEQAASQLHDLLYQQAAAVFPQTSGKQPRRQGRVLHQPWFDAECRAQRSRIRQQLTLALAAGSSSHLAAAAISSVRRGWQQLKRRKKADWHRQQGSALLQLQKHNPAKFFRKWQRRQPANPIPAERLVQHFAALGKRQFKPSNPAAPADPPPQAPATPPPPDAQLDADFTAADVEAAFAKLSPSSSCLGPLKAALLKAGKTTLLPTLTCLFNAVFRSGRYPPEWALGAITAIHKKGDLLEPNNYRGITVGHVLSKLYALLLNQRLTAWTEEGGKRASGQSGFRRGRQTTDNCFILRALIERARASGNKYKLYVAAVDLEKAFDSAARDHLWASLQRAGVGGCMLAALQAMYANVPVCVRAGGGLSCTFQSDVGVKQGCPLSPLLFGMFMDDLEDHMQAVGAAAALPMLAGHQLPPLLFADDVLLISTTAAGLRVQLNALQTYCDAKKLTVNAAKTQVMIFRPGGISVRQPAANDSFDYAGHNLEVAPKVKYLGLTLAQLSRSLGFAGCADQLASAGRSAMFAMRRRVHELGAVLPEQQLRLFDVLVAPILSYGCEVWGVDLLNRTDSASERVHRWFCRRLLRLPRHVSSAVALAELGRWPLHVHWAQQTARFWNRLLSMDADCPLQWAFQDNLALMRDGLDAGSPCWCRKWFTYLQSTPTHSGFLPWLTALDDAAVVSRAKAAYVATAATGNQHSQEAGEPAATKFSHYLEHVRGKQQLEQMAPHLAAAAVPNSQHRCSLTRLRTSCHALRIETDRHLPAAARPARQQRTCRLCASQQVEDEAHMIFHCPLYSHLRFEFADLFTPASCTSLATFLSQQNQSRIAAFIHACFVLRRNASP
jgi:hypothetical protein